MKISGVYKIQSIKKPNRCYVGSSVNIMKRWNGHFNALRNNKHHSPKLQHHYNKYGEEDLQFTILMGCDKNGVIEAEQYFLDALSPYFNMSKIALGSCDFRQTQQSIEKRRKSMTGKKWTDEMKRRFSEKCKGRPKSEAHKKALSISLKGNVPTPMCAAAREKMSKERSGKGNPMYGKKPWNNGRGDLYTDEYRKKMSDSMLGKVPWNKGTKMSEEQRIKLSLSQKGVKRKPRTAEHQLKLAESRKRNNVLRKLKAANG